MQITIPKKSTEDVTLDASLRPQSFNEYIGQERIKENLRILIEASKKRQEPMEHLLFYGGSGLGKTTLAYIMAHETKSRIKITSGPAVEKVGDLASLLTNLTEGEILFIDECHRLNRIIEEMLYAAMEEYVLDIVIGKGPSARVLRLDLPKFTLVGATTRMSLLSSPFRSRFGASFHLEFYNHSDIEKILTRSAKILNVPADKSALEAIARASRFTPRVANRILKRVRDYTQVKADGQINDEMVKKALALMEIDHLGLESTDRKILKTIIEKFNGGPAGIGAISAATNEEEDTIEEIYEPYLLQLGLLTRTPKGRIATYEAFKHLGYQAPKQNQLL